VLLEEMIFLAVGLVIMTPFQITRLLSPFARLFLSSKIMLCSLKFHSLVDLGFPATLQRNNSSLYYRNHNQNGVLNNSLGNFCSIQSGV